MMLKTVTDLYAQTLRVTTVLGALLYSETASQRWQAYHVVALRFVSL